jgi:uncharacterized membrane protein YphA (DoxX/SURF4 family)
MSDRLTTPWWTLRVALGAAAFLAGLDKFFNLLANWPGYLSPLAAGLLPMSAASLMHIVGIIEMAVGAGILLGYTRLGGYVASVWLVGIAANLVTTGHFFDIAVRDVAMAIAAFTLARLTEAGVGAAAPDRVAAATVVARRQQITVALLVAAMLPMASAARAQATHGHESTHGSAAATLHQDMRTLWTDHVIWTRDYIVAAVGDQPDQQAAAARLMKNQEDIGAAVAAYYGQPAGAKLTELLKAHISIAVDLIKAAKAGDSAAQQQADTQWHRNAEEIADFLSKANPNWPRATLVAMMTTHLSTTTDEVVARLTKNWDKDVRAFDAVYHHILAMSDALADGIVKQFPNKF